MLNLAIQSSIWQCLRSRDRETVSRDKESIGRAQAAGAVVAALCCVWVCSPRVWGPSPASHRHRLETKTEAGQRERERAQSRHRSYTTCAAHISPSSRQQSGSFLEIFRVHLTDHCNLIWTCHGSGHCFPPLACEQCRLQGQRKYRAALSLVTTPWDGVTVLTSHAPCLVKLKHACGHLSGCVLFTHSSLVGQGSSTMGSASHPACVYCLFLSRGWLCPSKDGKHYYTSWNWYNI